MRRDPERLPFVYGPDSFVPFFINMLETIPFHLYFGVFALPCQGTLKIKEVFIS